MHPKASSDWALVNEFGESKCFVNLSSIEILGSIIRASVIYSLSPPGYDRIHNKPTRSIINVEEYNVEKGTFRVRSITFQYLDGSFSAPFGVGPSWLPATAGNHRTLVFLQQFAVSRTDHERHTGHEPGAIILAGIGLNAKYGRFVRGKVVDNEESNPGLGYAVAYSAPAIGECTVYVYDNGFYPIPDGPMSPIARVEFDAVTQGIVSSANGSVQLVGRYLTDNADQGPEFLCAEFVVESDDASRRSFLYLTGARNQFIKIRITLRTNDPSDPTARYFADDVAHALRRQRTRLN